MTTTVATCPSTQKSTVPAQSIVSPDGAIDTQQFSTAHLRVGLRARSLRAGAVTVSTQALKFILTLASTAILARLLTPADFGLVAMVSVFTGFVGLFKDMGLTTATIQRAELTHAQVSTLFWINVALSVLLACMCIASAPLVAAVFEEPRLTAITIVIGASFLCSGVTAQHAALLLRQMRFATLALIEIGSLLCAITVALGLAVAGARYWALVAIVITQAAGMMLGTWLFSGWRPALPAHGTGVRPMLTLGSNLTGYSVLTYMTRSADNALIGAVLGAGPLGIYSKAYGLLMLPIRQVSSPLGSVALPALCRLRDDPAAYRRYFLRALEIMAYCGMPIVVFAFVESDRLVFLVLGSQWSDAVPVFRCLAPAALVGTFSMVPEWICSSCGTTHRLFRWAMVAAPLTILAFLLALPWGPVGVASAFSLAWCGLFATLLLYSSRGTPVHFTDMLAHLWHPALSAICAGGISAAITELIVPHVASILTLVCGGCAFALAYSVFSLAHPAGRRTVADVLSLLPYRLLKRNQCE